MPVGLLRRVLVARFFGELEQHLGVGDRADLRVPADHDLLELLLVLQQRLRLLLVVPEVRPRGDGVELLDLQALLVDVKVTSGARPPSPESSFSCARTARTSVPSIAMASVYHRCGRGAAVDEGRRRLAERDRVVAGEARRAVALAGLSVGCRPPAIMPSCDRYESESLVTYVLISSTVCDAATSSLRVGVSMP